MPTQPSPETVQNPPVPPAALTRWRCPAVLRVKSFVVAAAGVAVAAVFFPVWFGVPAAAAIGIWGLGLAALGASVTLDQGAGLLTLRMGLLVRRIRLADITAVLVDENVDENKVSLGRVNGGEVSFYAWRKSPLDALLRVPAEAGDIGHAISKAVTLAVDALGAGPASAGRSSARTRSRLATAWLGGAGAVAIAGALLVRVHWGNPALTVLSVVIALVLGVSGLVYLLVALWIALTGRAPRFTNPG